MQIIIEIPESDIPKQQNIIEIPLHFIDGKVCEAGGYGFDVLPKGHGRLGDLDALEKLCTEHEIASSAYDNSPMIEQGHCSDGDCI